MLVAAGLAGCDGAVVPPGGSGISSEDLPPGGCENRVDWDDDWAPLHAVFQYDKTGHLIHYKETRKDGTVRLALTRGYDAKGRRVLQEEEDNAFSPSLKKVTWEYDDADHVVRVAADGFAEGGGLEELELFYSADGRREREDTYQNGKLSQVARYRWMDGDPLVVELSKDWEADGKVDAKWRFTFAGGRWLVKLETLEDDMVEVTETYTYADDTPGRLIHVETHGTDGTMDSFVTWTWDGPRLVHEEFGGGLGGGTFDFTYDAKDRPLVKTLTPDEVPPKTYLSIFTWGDDGLERVERRVGDTDELIESWEITRGCPEDRALDVNIAPVVAWSRELPAVEYGTDLQTFWGFPDAL